MAEFQDLFTETSNTDIEDHTPDAGTGWTLESGTKGNCQIVGSSDNVRQQSTGGVWVSDNKANADHYTKFSMAQNANALYSDWFACARLVDSSNFLGIDQDAINSAEFWDVVAGSKDPKHSFTHVATDDYEINCQGNTIKVYQNGVQQGSDLTITSHNTETSQGFVLNGTARTNGNFDDYYADEITGGGGGGTTVVKLAGGGGLAGQGGLAGRHGGLAG